MVTIRRRFIRMARNLAVLFVLLLFALYTIVRSGRVQTFLAGKVAAFIAEKSDTEITIGGLSYRWPNSLTLNHILILDHHCDTMLYAKYLDVKLKNLKLKEKSFDISGVELNQGVVTVRKYINESQYNVQYFIQQLKPDRVKEEDTIPFKLDLSSINLEQVNFILQDDNKEEVAFGVDYFHLNCSDITAKLEDFHLVGDSINAHIKHLSCKEKSGFNLNHLSGDAIVCSSRVQLSRMSLVAGQTDLHGELAFNYKAYPDFKEFVKKVVIKSSFEQSKLGGRELSYFVPALQGLDEVMEIDGKIKGKISRLKLRDFELKYGNSTVFRGKLSIDGLPDFQNAFMHIDVEQLVTNEQDLRSIPLPPFTHKETLSLPEWFSNLGEVNFKGNYSGFINDFVAYGTFKSACGVLKSDVKFSKDSTENLFLSGSVHTTAFNLNKLIKNKELGLVSFRGEVDAQVKKNNFKVGLKGAVPLFDFHNYSYSGISVDGTLTPKKFEGDLNVVDTNLVMNFAGGIDFSKKLNQFKFRADVERAYLNKLHLLERDSSTNVSFRMDIDLHGNTVDDIQGNIDVNNFTWFEKGKMYSFNSTKLKSVKNVSNEMISIDSDWFQARIEGQYDLTELYPSLINILARDLPSLTNWKYSKSAFKGKNDFRLMFKVTDYQLINELFTPDLMLKGARFSGYFNDKTQEFRLNLNADTILYHNQFANKFKLYAHNKGDKANLNVKAKYISLNDSIGLRNFVVESSSKDDVSDFDISWKNETVKENRAHLVGSFGSENLDSLWTHFSTFDFVLEGHHWHMDELNKVVITPKDIRFDHFKIASEQEEINVNGLFSYLGNNNLDVSVKRFELKNLESIFVRYNTRVEGFLSGEFNLTGTLDLPVVKSNLSVEDFALNGQQFGKIWMNSKYFTSEGRLSLDLRAENRSKQIEGNTLEISGDYFPLADGRIDLVAKLTNLKVQFLEEYFSGVFSDFKRGKASGNLKLKGTIKNIEAYGVLRLDQLNLKVDYLNVEYAINAQSVYFNRNKISFRDFNLRHDKYTSSLATVNGTVYHKGFKSFTYKMDSIRMQDLFCLNTTIDDNSSYYGTAFVNGLLKIEGDGKNNSIKGAISTTSYEDKLNKGQTVLNLPLSEVGELEVSDFIRFVNLNEQQKTIKAEDQLDLSGLSMDFNFIINPDATAKIIFDPQVGDEITVKGSGNINMKINSEGKFLMSGKYGIEEGKYYFTLKNFVGKKFLVEKGSEITWDGDPINATIDIRTHYQVRAKLIDLISPSASNYEELSQRFSSKTLVNANLLLKGKLLQPDIGMDISLPQGTAEEKEFLSTHVIGADEANRQLFSLLLQNRFFTADHGNAGALAQAGSVGIDNGIQFLEGQLNNALGGLMNNVDLGLDYNSSSDSLSNAELRLLVGFSYKKFSVKTDYDVSNNVGEIQVEYKITDEFKARAYSKKLENIVVETGATVTHGAGMVYQKSFNNLRDLFRRKKTKKKADQSKKRKGNKDEN